MAPRATLTLSALTADGCAVIVKYFRDTYKTLETYCKLHNVVAPSLLKATPSSIVRDLRDLQPPLAQVLQYQKGRLITLLNLDASSSPSNAFPFPLCFLIRNKTLYFIKSVRPTFRCDICGSYFQQRHTCNARRAEFYYHQIDGVTSKWWETIAFCPVGAPPTRRLFLVYDIETYTWHGAFGKQLVPFLLVFALTGDTELVQRASTLAEQEGWHCDGTTFYLLNPTRKLIGQRFLQLRLALQKDLCALLWDLFLEDNKQTLSDFALRAGIYSPELLTFNELCNAPLKGRPSFFEIIIIGHNISGFDEIVLAAQTLDQETCVYPAFQVSRNFMPRNGRLLFNDITYALPNPAFNPKPCYSAWEEGRLLPSDLRTQYVRVMVRDTFALTHTSLRNAAKAYALPVSKGHCPYNAVNEFFMCGSYLQDSTGFPAAKYWSSQTEYEENHKLWVAKKEHAYDIVQEVLSYCQQDVLVTVQLVQCLLRSYQEFISSAAHFSDINFNVFQRPTISANSHALFRQLLFRAVRPQQPSLGTYLMAPSDVMYDFVRQSIRGGRCYPTWLGVFHEPIYVYDICGMYASALTHPLPVGRPLSPLQRATAINHYISRLKLAQSISYFDNTLLPAIFVIDADPPEENQLDVLPPFCSRRGGRLCWTNESLRGEVATSIDAITLHNRGWSVRILSDERTTVFPGWACLARDYVKLNIAAKEQATKDGNQTLRSISKLLSNALYGSFATRLDNRRIIFQKQLDDKLSSQIANGEYVIKSTSFLETENLCAELMPKFVAAYSPPPSAHPSFTEDGQDESADIEPLSYITPNAHHVTEFKPITFLETTDEDMCLLTLERTTDVIENNRYPSHIASFVLAWTRAFMSEWAGFLFDNDRGTPIEKRVTKSVYGDTDSLFLTEEGHRLMLSKGKHRLKTNGGSLVFDPSNPNLTWLVECETICSVCGKDAYSVESVFLAPKLYALRKLQCSTCKAESKGKLRAKGHATTSLDFHTLKECFLSHTTSHQTFSTSRHTLKRTLVNNQPHTHPFTVLETKLTRTLRPWQDLTLHRLDLHRLSPYSNAHPNPRNQTTVTTAWMDMTSNL